VVLQHVQFVFAGNDSEGLKYGTIGTPEKYFLRWKEDEAGQRRLQARQVPAEDVRKDRLIELMHDFVLFDGGVKKLPRAHQYFGIKAAQEHVRQIPGRHHLAHPGQRQEHRHGAAGQVDSGEQPQRPRAIITDRDELDKQIERVFTDAGEPIKRHQQRPRPDAQLGQATPRLLCSLVHKFGREGTWTTSTPSSRSWRPAQPGPSARCSSSWTNATARRAASCTG
jgi:type I restriction enzyme, R subunit